ncbi:MAG: hypothetical protein HUK20_14940 [Fibrobacter sp.]|nr:hypothetical protein [Fibrobacter sp.]
MDKKEYWQKYKKENSEKLLDYYRSYYWKNKERILKRMKAKRESAKGVK